MKRYCVSQLDSNVVYVFGSQEQAHEYFLQLGLDKGPRWWSVQPKDHDPLPPLQADGHALICFPQAIRA